MQQRSAVVVLSAAVVIYLLVATAAMVFVVTRYLSSDPRSVPLAAGLFVFGIMAASGSYFVLSRARSAIWPAVMGGLCLVPLLAMVVSPLHGQVTYARFGLTVYGLVPVPLLDITVNSDGLLWFRDKTHEITAEEVRQLASAETSVIIVGTGWYDAAHLNREAYSLKSISIRAYPTGAAIEEYNKLRRRGVAVALLLHTTC